eukprot:24091_1
MSLSAISVKLDCELKFHWYIPKPSDHPKKKDVIILSTHYLERNNKTALAGIYEYNTKKNTCNKIFTYQGFKPWNHGQFIDAKNELLYMFGNGKLGIFNLNTKVMNTNTESL